MGVSFDRYRAPIWLSPPMSRALFWRYEGSGLRGHQVERIFTVLDGKHRYGNLKTLVCANHFTSEGSSRAKLRAKHRNLLSKEYLYSLKCDKNVFVCVYFTTCVISRIAALATALWPGASKLNRYLLCDFKLKGFTFCHVLCCVAVYLEVSLLNVLALACCLHSAEAFVQSHSYIHTFTLSYIHT